MRFERRTADESTEFWVLDAEPHYAAALDELGWERRDGGWAKSFRRPVPEQAMGAFVKIQQLLEPMLRQFLGLAPVPWEDALTVVCRRFATTDVDWWLCGSGALAVRGAAIIPRDLDLVIADADAVRVGGLLADGLIEPVCPAGWPISNWWGRAFLLARVEWVGGVTAAADEPQVADFGPAAADNLQVISWRQWQIRVPPAAPPACRFGTPGAGRSRRADRQARSAGRRQPLLMGC